MTHVLSFGFFAESVPFTLIPLAGVRVAARPCVSPARLVAAVPRSLVAALAGGTGADSVSIGLASRPAAAVRAAVVESEPAADLLLLLMMMMRMMIGRLLM